MARARSNNYVERVPRFLESGGHQTHDPRYAGIADRTIHLFDGRIVEETLVTRRASLSCLP